MTEVERIRHQMQVRGLVWITLAKRANVDHREVYRWCLHKEPVSQKTRLAVLAELGLIQAPRRYAETTEDIRGSNRTTASFTVQEANELLARGRAAGLKISEMATDYNCRTEEFIRFMEGKPLTPAKKKRMISKAFLPALARKTK